MFSQYSSLKYFLHFPLFYFFLYFLITFVLSLVYLVLHFSCFRRLVACCFACHPACAACLLPAYMVGQFLPTMCAVRCVYAPSDAYLLPPALPSHSVPVSLFPFRKRSPSDCSLSNSVRVLCAQRTRLLSLSPRFNSW
jgi:hypothetical protein